MANTSAVASGMVDASTVSSGERGMADTSTVTSGEQQEADVAPQLSKRQAARKKRTAARCAKRRAKEKEARIEMKRIRTEKRASGELLGDDGDSDEDEGRQKKKIKLEFGGKVVIDLGFDDKMTNKEIMSLCSQLACTYSANRKAFYPFSLLFTSLNGRTMTRLERMHNVTGHKRWTETEWWTQGYEHLWTLSERPAEGQVPDAVEAALRSTSSLLNAGAQAKSSQDTVVYLTADSEEELLEVKPEETYIIGGICDHNRYKNLCLDKAKESGIRTARLPIWQYPTSLPAHEVLTVNQVFEIMAKWVMTRSWEEALYSIVPKQGTSGSVAEIVQ